MNPNFKSENEIKQSNVILWNYDYGNSRGLNIVISDIGGLHGGGKRYDYYYSLEQIAGDLKMIIIDTVNINDHNWIKYVEVSENKKFLCTGYFTRKHEYLILVYRWVWIGNVHIQEIEKYKKTFIMTDYLKQLLDDEFKEADKLFKIVL